MVMGDYLCNVPLHSVGYHPSLPERAPIAITDWMFILIEHGRITCAIVPTTSTADDHVAFQTPQHSTTHNSCPGVYGLVDLNRLWRIHRNKVCWSLRVWRRWRRVEV